LHRRKINREEKITIAKVIEKMPESQCNEITLEQNAIRK
jgi:hypothetical protein